MSGSDILIYTNQDGDIKVDVRLEERLFGLRKTKWQCFLVNQNQRLTNTLKIFFRKKS